MKMGRFYRFALPLLALLQANMVNGGAIELRQSEPQFVKLNLLQEEVTKVIQDDNGFLWFGTLSGLKKFDGHKLTTYSSNSSDSSLSHNSIVDITKIDDGTLWISTYGGGLNRFDPRTHTFSYFHHDEQSAVSLSTNVLWDIEKGPNNQLLIGSRNWLNRFNTDTLQNQRLNAEEGTLEVGKNIWSIMFISEREIWLSVLMEGIYIWDPISDSLSQIKSEDQKVTGLTNNLVRTMVNTPDNKVWLGTDSGLNLYDKNTLEIKHYYAVPEEQHSLSSSEINKIYLDSKGRTWIGTYGGGLNLYRQKTDDFQHFAFDYLPLEDRPKIINDIFEDAQGNIWVASNNGVYKLPALGFEFPSWQFVEPDNPIPLSMWNLHQSDQSGLWVAAGDSIFNVDLSTNRILCTVNGIGKVFAVAEAEDGSLWLGTDNNGLLRISIEGEVLERLTADSGDNRLPSGSIDSLYLDNEQNLWVGFQNTEKEAGLVSISPQGRVSDMLLKGKNVFKIIPDDNDELLVGTSPQGMYVLSIDKLTVRPQLQSQLTHISDIFEDSMKNLWVASDNAGIAKVTDNKLDSFWLDQRQVAAITEIPEGTLWATSANRLFSIDIAKAKVKHFSNADGLIADGFLPGLIQRQGDKELVFLSRTYIHKIVVGGLIKPKSPAQVRLTEFSILNKPVLPGDNSYPDLLSSHISYSSILSLPANAYSFSIEFSALDYADADTVKYQFMLEGLDLDWLETDARYRSATYTTLAPGNYRLRVRRTNAAESETYLDIIINPPWWRTNIAYVAYAISFVALFWIFIRMREHSLKRYSRALEIGINNQTAELEKQNKTIRELLEQKKRLFANLSHELRTPLTLILSPIGLLMTRSFSREDQEQLNLVQGNAKRLQRLVEQILELARIDNQNKQLQVVNVSQCAKFIIHSLAFSLEDKDLKLETNFNIPQDLSLSLTMDTLETILLNLLSNAVKYTSPGGSIILTFSIDADEKLKIEVFNSGEKIPEPQRAVIFERFDRGTHQGDETISGSGLGLALVKEILEANSGEIYLKDNVHNGNSFIAVLPIRLASGIQQQRINISSEPTSTVPKPTSSMNIAPRSNNSEKPLVLLIEDNTELLAHLVDCLFSDFDCITARNGEEGLIKAISDVPDIVVSDIMMPKADGYAVCNGIRNNPITSHIPILLLTAKSSEKDRIRGWQSNIDGYMIKPFSPQELTIRIYNILSIRQILSVRIADELFKGPQGNIQHLALWEADQTFLDKFVTVIEHNMTDSDLSLRDVAKQTAVSERQLQRKLKSLTGQDFTDYLRHARLAKSKELLAIGKPVSVVSDLVGFAAHSYFSTCFKVKFGITPKKYQLEQKNLQKQRRHHSKIESP